VAETDEQAHAEGRQHIEWLFHKGLKQGLERVMPPGYTSLCSLRGMLLAQQALQRAHLATQVMPALRRRSDAAAPAAVT
jgi:hypothetical protein